MHNLKTNLKKIFLKSYGWNKAENLVFEEEKCIKLKYFEMNVKFLLKINSKHID